MVKLHKNLFLVRHCYSFVLPNQILIKCNKQCAEQNCTGLISIIRSVINFSPFLSEMPKLNKTKHKKGVKHKSKESRSFSNEQQQGHHIQTSQPTKCDEQISTKKKLKKKKKLTKDANEVAKVLAKLAINDGTKKVPRRLPNTTSTRASSSYSAGSDRSSRIKIATLEDVARLIVTDRAKNIVVMCGAGISTASGIPDFRTPGTGLYDNLQRYNIPYPTAVFDLDYFHTKPKPFFELAKELYPSGKYRPNIAHYFLRALHEKGMLLRVYTQNIDGLERLSGIPPSKLVEAHGTFTTASCIKCGKKYNGKDIKHKIFKGIVPRCELTPLCWGVIKPDIVFFGEDLPKRFYYYLKDFPLCDMLIVMGTSLEVEPFASLVDSVRHNVPRLLLNREKVGPFKSKKRSTDLAATGELAETIQHFSLVLGWKKFVKDLMEDNEKEAVQKARVEATLDNQVDSGISSASSVSSDQQKETPRRKTLPPHNGNIKRYFHTLRTTPLPRYSSESNIHDSSGKPSCIPSSLSYYNFIRNSSKPSIPSNSLQTVSSTFQPKSTQTALELLDQRTLAKSNAPVIQYASVEKRKDKRTPYRCLSSVSTPSLARRRISISESSEDETDDSSDSVSSSDS